MGWLLNQEWTEINGRARNRHTVFFIPMQFAGILIAILGLCGLVVGLIG